MSRRSRAGGEPTKSQRHKAVTPKRRTAPESVGARGSSVAGQETEVARLAHERDEALEQQRATSEILGVVARSRASRANLVSWVSAEERRRHTVVALRRFGISALRLPALASLLPALERRRIAFPKAQDRTL